MTDPQRSRSKQFWDNMFDGAEQAPFGDEATYRLAADYIGNIAVEDWGCGLGWFRRFAQGAYRGVDGSPSKFADEVADLSVYRSKTPALFMRHVLEHNPKHWKAILDNAIASFHQMMCIVLHTPLNEDGTTLILPSRCEGNVPDLSFRLCDLTSRFPSNIIWWADTIDSTTVYGVETILYAERLAPR